MLVQRRAYLSTGLLSSLWFASVVVFTLINPYSLSAQGNEPAPGAAERLEQTLDSTGWFEDVDVRTESGVVLVEGIADTREHKDWATSFLEKSDDVTAVVNKLRVTVPNVWSRAYLVDKGQELLRQAADATPLLVFALLILTFFWVTARFTAKWSPRLFSQVTQTRLLQQVLAKALGFFVFLLGLYLVLRIAGLSGLAATVLGSTGVLGLIFGFAFRDIAENFLASVLLSAQRPFALGDLVQVAGTTGLVQQLTLRSTVLMTLAGNHVQIPNAEVYKNTITNYTANPKVQQDFVIGIGTEESISNAQKVAMQAIQSHSAVLADPEPWVLVDSIGSATVNLRVYFWMNGQVHSMPKVKSAVIRLVKRAFDTHEISMPDEAREVIFPEGIPLRRPEETAEAPVRPELDPHDASESTSGEGALESEVGEIREQARLSRSPETGANLLE
ncbi:MAG: mechanosensitive ion channel [Bdellovibrionales bacterium]|nr:mechanosensitive ion channel [Bdellovibrionales bacterium]